MKKVTFKPEDKQIFEAIYLWFSLPSDQQQRVVGIEAHRQSIRILDAFATTGELFYDEAGEPRPGAITMHSEGGSFELCGADIDKLKASVERASTIPAFSALVVRCWDFLAGVQDAVSNPAS